MKTTTNAGISRRQFLGGAAVATAVFNIVPGSVLGLNGATPPSERLNIAGIGIGGQGAADLGQMTSENIVALCDVDWSYAAGIFKKYPNAKPYKDYRKMLDEQKPNIVWAFVENNRHLEIAKACAARKINIMFEKPLAATYKEAAEIRDLARSINDMTGQLAHLQDIIRKTERLRRGKRRPSELAPWLKARKDLLLASRIQQGRVTCPHGCHLRRGQARRSVAAPAFEHFRIELALFGIFQHAVLHAVRGIARVEDGVMDQRVLAGREVTRFVLVHRLRN